MTKLQKLLSWMKTHQQFIKFRKTKTTLLKLGKNLKQYAHSVSPSNHPTSATASLSSEPTVSCTSTPPLMSDIYWTKIIFK